MTADTVGGVWTYSLELAQALSAEGVRVSLATMGAPVSPDQRRQASAIERLTIFEGHYRLEWMQDSWADVDRSGEWLLSLEEELQPDLIHVNGYAHGALHWQAPCIVAAHSCVFSWWNAVLGTDPPAVWSKYRDRVRAGLFAADAVVAISRAMADSLRAHYDFNGSRVVYNGRSGFRLSDVKKEHFVLTSGRAWDDAKNIRALDDVAPRLAWPVYLAGDSTHPEGGTAPLSNLGHLGKLSADEMQSWFARAAVYALPAQYEPFGLSVLEAALSGCALVLGDIPSLRELWKDAALFVPSRDPKAITAAINSLASSEVLRNNFAQRARERARRFSSERMLSAYLKVYDQVRQGALIPCG